MLADVINVQLRTNNFIDYSHQKKLAYSTSSTKDILKLAKEILANMYNGEPIRLIGVRVDNLTKEDEIQLSFFSNDNSKQNNLDKTLDNITNKYGISSITRASKLNVDINYKENQDNKKRI